MKITLVVEVEEGILGEQYRAYHGAINDAIAIIYDNGGFPDVPETWELPVDKSVFVKSSTISFE